jgi:hypothetical protein
VTEWPRSGWLLAGFLERGGYSATRDYISELSAVSARHAWLMDAANAVCGLATVAFASLGFSRAAAPVQGRSLAALAIAFSALGLDPLADLLFRLDCRTIDGCSELRQMASWHGTVHGIVSVATALVLVLGPYLVARYLRRAAEWSDRAPILILLGVLIDVAALGSLLPGYAGLAQRLMLLLGSVWIGVLAQRALSLLGDRGPRRDAATLAPTARRASSRARGFPSPASSAARA